MKTIIYLMIAFLLTSCSMQKRKYTNGWSINWNKSFHSAPNSNEINPANEPKSDSFNLIKSVDSVTQTKYLITETEKSVLISNENDSLSSTEIEIKTDLLNSNVAESKLTNHSKSQKANKWVKKYKSLVKKANIKMSKKIVNRKQTPTKMIGVVSAILIVLGIIIFIILLFSFIALIQLINGLFDELFY